MSDARDIQLVDHALAAEDLAREALAGLRAQPKTLPAKLFYDERGSELFEQICELPEYYLTRTEMGILEENLPAIVDALGPRAQLIEPGSGASTKTALLLGALHEPAGYVPIDISREHLLSAARRIRKRFPGLEVQAVCADFFQPLQIPRPSRAPRRRIVFFPGSTIGNFHAPDAARFLDRLAELAGSGGGLLLGFDLRKDPDVLVAAYDDAKGVTAAFNRNALRRLNADAGANFDVTAFEHEARWNADESRIEMHLVSTREQEVRIGTTVVRFARGESIRTECCYKYGRDGVAALAARCALTATWFDAQSWFGVQLLEVR